MKTKNSEIEIKGIPSRELLGRDKRTLEITMRWTIPAPNKFENISLIRYVEQQQHLGHVKITVFNSHSGQYLEQQTYNSMEFVWNKDETILSVVSTFRLRCFAKKIRKKNNNLDLIIHDYCKLMCIGVLSEPRDICIDWVE